MVLLVLELVLVLVLGCGGAREGAGGRSASDAVVGVAAGLGCASLGVRGPRGHCRPFRLAGALDRQLLKVVCAPPAAPVRPPAAPFLHSECRELLLSLPAGSTSREKEAAAVLPVLVALLVVVLFLVWR